MKKLAASFLSLAAVAALWWLLAPPLLGGSVTYVVTSGTSMQPQFRTGDLALVRQAAEYRVGEVVAYRSRTLGTIVLHRIVANAGDGYVFKGDNNSWRDPEHPTRDQLVGRLWLHVPSGGKELSLIDRPIPLGLLAGGGVLLLLGATATRRRRSRRAQREQARPRPAPRAASAAVAVSAVGLVAFGALAAVGYERPTTRTVQSSATYRHTGSLTYSGVAERGTVYPSGRVTTGAPVFLRLVKRLDVDFTYVLRSASPRVQRGTARLVAEVADTSGWRRELILQPRTAFAGDTITLQGTLHLDDIRTLIRRFEAAIGASGAYTLTVVPDISAGGMLAGRTLESAFAPRIVFTLDTLRLAPPPPETGPTPLEPTATRSLALTQQAASTIALRWFRIPVALDRKIAPPVAGVCLLALLASGLLLLRGRRAAEPARIRARYGRMLVPVVGSERGDYSEVVEVATFETLVQLAERYDRVILHEQNDLGDTYRVADDGVLYVYVVPCDHPSLELAPASSDRS
jgi:signal peptidase I